MKLRIKIDDEPLSIVKEGPLLSDLVEKISNTDVSDRDMAALREGAAAIAHGSASLAKINQEFVRDSLSDAVAVARSLTRIRTPQDLIEHQIGVGLMMVTGAVTQFERVRDTLDGTAQTLQQIAKDHKDGQAA